MYYVGVGVSIFLNYYQGKPNRTVTDDPGYTAGTCVLCFQIEQWFCDMSDTNESLCTYIKTED